MSDSRFSALLLEGLDHYRKGRMLEAVRSWEEAYALEPTNLRAREFLRSALERIHSHMGTSAAAPKPAPAAGHPWLQQTPPQVPDEAPADFFHPPTSPADGNRAAFFEAPTASPRAPAKQKGPWDDGPSVAIEQPEDPGDETSGAWSIHDESAPAKPEPHDEAPVWMKGARELLGLNDFSGALELLAKVLERTPDDREALQMHELCEHNLTLMYESKIGSMESRPRIAIQPDEVIWLNLDPRAGFVLAQIDGEVTFEDLYAICGLRRLDTARILSQLLEEGVVQVDGADAAVAKRSMHRR